MITVIGGAYREICLHPQWNALFGSGVRAAAAIAALASAREVHLHTWASPSSEVEVKGIAATYGFGVQVHRSENLIEFQYDHPLSPPRLYPDIRNIKPVSIETISTENAVCFSLIEGAFRLQTRKLVFDPQAGRRAKTPRASGHLAETIAIVANVSEVQAMLQPGTIQLKKGDHVPSVLGTALLHQEQCAVVVVKNAAEGAMVVTPDGCSLVPSYIVERVFPIGSGDVFTGIFAHFWLEEGCQALEAAQLASAGTALYCGSRVLPVPANLREMISKMQPAPATTTQPRVYLAGPLFTLPQLWLLNEAKRSLEGQDLVVFSPKDEVGYHPNPEDARKVAQADLRGLDAADIVFAILDGLDSGTIFEVGYARAKNKPVIGFSQCTDPGALTMLLGTECHVYDDYATAVYQTAWKARSL